MATRPANELLLGEWACLAIIYAHPQHGFAVAAKLKPDSEIGRVWTMSRALTYRAIDQLAERGLIEPIGEEQGIAGGNRTVYKCTRKGSAAVRKWLRCPVEHVRDIRSELLLKLVLGNESDVESADLVTAQAEVVRTQFEQMRAELELAPDNVVLRWRVESADAALRFLNQL